MDRFKSTRFPMNPGRYLWIFAVACVCFAAVLVCINLFVDRYYVFHPQDGEFYESLEPNTRFLKASYLEAHCADFDAVIMGSSRDVGYLTSDVDRAFGVTSFNYGVAAGNLRGIKARLEWLASMECLPSQIVLPLSIDKLRLPQRPDDLLRKEHPSIVDTSGYRREFILSYIGTDAFVSNVRKLFRLLRQEQEPKFRYEMSTGDVWYLWHRSFDIERCTDAAHPAQAPVIREFTDFLFAIDRIARENRSTVTLLWNPQPLGSQLAHVQDAESLFALISERFENIYRLPFDDPRLVDSQYFHDRGHFTHELGAAVVSDPANRIGLSQLLSELREAALLCEHPNSE